MPINPESQNSVTHDYIESIYQAIETIPVLQIRYYIISS